VFDPLGFSHPRNPGECQEAGLVRQYRFSESAEFLSRDLIRGVKKGTQCRDLVYVVIDPNLEN
jgi:hypothetical protein